MQITTDITLNLSHPNINLIVHAKQNDKLSRYITATLMDGNEAWEPPEGALATIRFAKPDGHVGFYDTDEEGNPAVTFNGSTAHISLAEQLLSAAGQVLTELTMYTADGERLTTFYWIVKVEQSALTDEEIESSDYYSVLTQQITEVLARIDSVAGITASAQSIPYGEDTYVVVTGGGGVEDPYVLDFYIESARPMTPKGDYDEDTTYNKLDLVLYNASTWCGMQDDFSGITPGTDSDYWQLVSAPVSVESQENEYAAQAASDYTGTPPTTGWQEEIPQAIPGGYLWTKITTTYTDGGTFVSYVNTRNGNDGQGAPGSSTPLMDGTATAGTASAFSREDHVHPKDTSKIGKTVLTGTLPATGWTGDEAPYSKSVTVPGIPDDEDADIFVDVEMSGTYSTDSIMSEDWAKIYRIVPSEDTLTFYATDTPEAAITFKVVVLA